MKNKLQVEINVAALTEPKKRPIVILALKKELGKVTVLHKKPMATVEPKVAGAFVLSSQSRFILRFPYRLFDCFQIQPADTGLSPFSL